MYGYDSFSAQVFISSGNTFDAHYALIADGMTFTEEKAIQHESKVQLLLYSAEEQAKAFYAQGRYQEALDICLQVIQAHPDISDAWTQAAVNCGRLGRWEDAIHYGQMALTHGANTLGVYDTLTQGYGKFKQGDEARHYGLQALEMRDRLFGGKPVIPLAEPGPMPPLPSTQTRGRNIIAFSLFGRDPKYCETAVLNVQDQPQIYPHWVCRFYVDASVPEHVIHRLQAGGAQIVPVVGAAAQWPGEMWRLLALDDPQMQRVLFRDADSVISRREAAAVDQWLASGKRFHMMRDHPGHIELIMAGLWGVAAGSLPPFQQLMQRFRFEETPIRHFADQDFLRRYVWPYARASLMQHDSMFGFRDAAPFPISGTPDSDFIGMPEGSLGTMTIKSDQPDGTEITWIFCRIEKIDDSHTQEKPVCFYTHTVQGGLLRVPIPRRYAQWVQQGTACVRLVENGASSP